MLAEPRSAARRNGNNHSRRSSRPWPSRDPVVGEERGLGNRVLGPFVSIFTGIVKKDVCHRARKIVYIITTFFLGPSRTFPAYDPGTSKM